MDYNQPLVEGQFVKRYKRFFAEVQIGTDSIVAHVPNTGSLKGVCDQPRPCRIQPCDNPERKLKFTLEQVKTETSWVGVNTQRANTLAFEAFNKKQMPHWREFTNITREVKINPQTRLDMMLTGGNKNHYVEVKSVTLAENGLALFPDAVTIRGQKHLHELMILTQQGATAELLFIVQRADCMRLAPADRIDQAYGQLLREAAKSGVKITAYPTIQTNDRVELNLKELELFLF